MAGLDFRTAIDAHVRWKTRLEAYIDRSSGETLKVEPVFRDDQCVLGKWIYGEGGQRYGNHELSIRTRDDGEAGCETVWSLGSSP